MILSFFLFYKRVVIDVGAAYHLNMEGYFTCMKVNLCPILPSFPKSRQSGDGCIVYSHLHAYIHKCECKYSVFLLKKQRIYFDFAKSSSFVCFFGKRYGSACYPMGLLEVCRDYMSRSHFHTGMISIFIPSRSIIPSSSYVIIRFLWVSYKP